MALTKITSDVIETGAITSDKLASGAVSASSLSSITTDNVSEGTTNTYFTNARARGAVSVTGGNLSYDSNTGVLQLTTDTIRSAISAGTGVTYSTGQISIGQDVSTTATPTFGNITTTGYIAGPATFTIDPAAVGDNTGTVVIAGNLQVDGTTTTINSTTMTVDDLNITLASGALNAAAANGAGITVDGASATITYDGTNDEWDFNKNVNITGTVTASGNITGTLATAAQTNITSIGTLSSLTVNSGTTNTAAQFISTDSGAGIKLTDNVGSSSVQTTDEVLRIGVDDDAVVASSAIAFRVDGSEKARIDSSGNVGIGTTSPSSYSVSNLVVSDTGNNVGLSIISDSTGMGKIHFGDGTTGSEPYRGVIRYQHSSDTMDFWTGAVAKMTIDSSGNVGIGTSSPSYKLEVAGDASFLGQDVLIDSQSGYKELRHTQTGENFAISSPESLYFIMDSNNDQTNRSIVFANNNTAPASATELMRIREDGNVGIGNTSPLGKLTISNAAGANAPTTVSAANTYLQLGSDDYGPAGTGKFMIGFGYTDATNTNSPAYIGFEETSSSGDTKGELTFYTRDVITDTAPTERMTITSSGNVLIGNTVVNPASGFGTIKGFGFNNTNGVVEIAANTGAAPLQLGLNHANNGDVLVVRKQGTVMGSIGTEGGDTMYIVSNDTGLRLHGGIDAVVPANANGAARDAAIDIGSSSQRFKDIYLSGGIHLGGTTSVNQLDDYEIGTYTHGTLNGSGVVSAISEGSHTSNYVKVGKLITVNGSLTCSFNGAGKAVVVFFVPNLGVYANSGVAVSGRIYQYPKGQGYAGYVLPNTSANSTQWYGEFQVDSSGTNQLVYYNITFRGA